jgi:hypothetical protein
MNYRLTLILILSGLTSLVIIRNVVAEEIQYKFWSIQISQSLLIFFLSVVGIIMGWFLHGYLKQSRGGSMSCISALLHSL